MLLDFSSPVKENQTKRQELESRLRRGSLGTGQVEKKTFTKEELLERKRELLAMARRNVQSLKKGEPSYLEGHQVTPSFDTNKDEIPKLGSSPKVSP